MESWTTCTRVSIPCYLLTIYFKKGDSIAQIEKIAMLLLAFLMIMPNLPQPANASSAAPAGIKGIGAGYLHSLLIAGDGTVWTMGDNSAGALGNGTTDNAFRPVPVTKFDGTPLGNAKFVTGGGYFSVALLNDGTVWAWGRGVYGTLGNGASDNQHRAVQVTESGGGPLTNVRSIAAAYNHVLAIKEDGSAWGGDPIPAARLPIIMTSSIPGPYASRRQADLISTT